MPTRLGLFFRRCHSGRVQAGIQNLTGENWMPDRIFPAQPLKDQQMVGNVFVVIHLTHQSEISLLQLVPHSVD
jgi:hypothetical protein